VERDKTMLAKVLQALILVVLVNLVAISGYYTVDAMMNDTDVPLFLRLTFIGGLVIFIFGLAFVTWERIRARRQETFRRVKW